MALSISNPLDTRDSDLQCVHIPTWKVDRSDESTLSTIRFLTKEMMKKVDAIEEATRSICLSFAIIATVDRRD